MQTGRFPFISRFPVYAATVLLAAAACGDRAGSPPSPDAGAPAGSPKIARSNSKPNSPAGERGTGGGPVPRDGDGDARRGVAWFPGSFDDALARARETGRLVFVDVGAYWCPPCQRLDEETFPDPKLRTYLEQAFVPLHVDAEEDEGPSIVERYHVMAYPTLLVLSPTGVEKGRVVDFLPPGELRARLQRIAAGEDLLAELDARARAHPDDLALVYRAAHAHMLAARRERAEELLRILELADPTGAAGLLPKVQFSRAAMVEKIDGDCARAASLYRKVAQRFEESPVAVYARRREARCLLRLGRAERARRIVEGIYAEGAGRDGDPDLLSAVAWFCFRNRTFLDLGRDAARKGAARDPSNAEFPYLEAEIARLTGDLSAALAAMQKAAQLAPGRVFYRQQVERLRRLAGSPQGGLP